MRHPGEWHSAPLSHKFFVLAQKQCLLRRNTGAKCRLLRCFIRSYIALHKARLERVFFAHVNPAQRHEVSAVPESGGSFKAV